MTDKLQILEEQVKALKELLAIKDQVIAELKMRPLSSPPQYIYVDRPVYHPSYPYYYWSATSPNWGTGIFSGGATTVNPYQGATSGYASHQNLGSLVDNMHNTKTTNTLFLSTK